MSAGAPSGTAPPPGIDVLRRRQVRRNTALLAVAQAALLVSSQAILTVATVAAVDLTGRESSAGVVTALYFLAAAGGALVFGRLMDRLGRRPGLAAGYGLIAVSGVLAALAMRAGSGIGLLASSVPFGAGTGAGLLGRGAVADMHPPEVRGRAVGLLLAAGTAGAVGGPLLMAVAQGLAGDRGADPFVVSWLVVAGFGVVGAVCALALRPDPRDLAIAAGPGAGAPARSPRELVRLPPFRTALVVTGASQMSMVAVMGVTPVVIHQDGGGGLVISAVISGHLAGMYAFSPLFGAAIDRWGRRLGLLSGALVSAVGAVLAAALSGLAGSGLVGIGLFLVGLGWSAAYVSVTAVISDVTEPHERGAALGFNDLWVSTASTVAALVGGIVLEAAGFVPLALAMAVLIIPAALLATGLQEPTPGRWTVAERVRA